MNPMATTDRVVPCESEPAQDRVLRLCEGCAGSVYADAGNLRGMANGGRCACWSCAVVLFDTALSEIAGAYDV